MTRATPPSPALAAYRSDRAFYLRLCRDARAIARKGGAHTLPYGQRSLVEVRADYREACAKPFTIERLPTGELHRANTAATGERFRIDPDGAGLFRLVHRSDAHPEALDYGRSYSFKAAVRTMAEGMREDCDTREAVVRAAEQFLAREA